MEYPRRSSQEWLDLITDCRTSGMTITAWCKAHSIPKGSYESAVSKASGKPGTSGTVPKKQDGFFRTGRLHFGSGGQRASRERLWPYSVDS